MQQAREKGYKRGFAEARQFKSVTGKVFKRQQGLDWLETAIRNGRAELQSQNAPQTEIEAWDMSCRIAFMVAIV